MRRGKVPIARMGGKALIKVGYGCNQDCGFCHTSSYRDVEGSAEEIHAKIERAAELGHRMVVLSGGEPTLRSELLGWADHASRLGLEFGLVTNGLRLGEPGVLQGLLAKRLGYVYQSLHGGTAEIHERVVRSRTFTAAWRAVEALAGRGLHYTLQLVVTRLNMDHLDEFVDRTLRFPDLVVKFSMVYPKGGGESSFDRLIPTLTEAAGRVHAAILRGQGAVRESGEMGPSFVHDGFPLCLLPGLEGSFDDLKTNGFCTMTEVGETDFTPVDDLIKVQPEAVCAGCALRGPCPGLYVGYRELRGAGEIAPVLGEARPGSFAYRFEELVTRSAATGTCPLRDGPLGIAPWDRGRQLFVRHGARIARFSAQTRVFSDAEIEATKFRTGQVYLDGARESRAADAGRDLVPLARSPLCGTCRERDSCTGLWEPDLTQSASERDRSRAQKIVESLSGDVLGVGCGSRSCGKALADLARSGAIRYAALGREAEAAFLLRFRWPWVEPTVGRATDLDALLADGPAFDHVLLGRVWSERERLADALAAVGRSLRSGGTVTLVGSVILGLAQTSAQERLDEIAPPEIDDHAPGLIVRKALSLGWALAEQWGPTPYGGREWYLRFSLP